MKQRDCDCNHHGHMGGGSSGAVYGLGVIGALVYFLQNVNTFQAGLFGVLKAIVWPAYLVYYALGFFKL